MAKFSEIWNYITHKEAPVETESTSVSINPATNLPSVSETMATTNWIASSTASHQDTWAQDTWVTSAPPMDKSQAARHDHPAGSERRTPTQRWADRRAQRGYGAEYGRQAPMQRPYVERPGYGPNRGGGERYSGGGPGDGGGGGSQGGRIENPNPPPGYKS